MQAYEATLLRNKFDHLAYSPSILSDKDRNDNIKMFLLSLQKDQLDVTARVSDHYPQFNKPFGELSKSERREF